jgi:hypothetical protein
MIWLYFWLFIGTLWSWQALSEYFATKEIGMGTGWQVFNIFLNTLFLPFGLIFGMYIFVVIRKIVRDEEQLIDLDLTFLKMITRYEKKTEDN